MTTPTHIRLTRIDVTDGQAIILPLAQTRFVIDAQYTTIALTTDGARFEIDEGLPDIEEALIKSGLLIMIEQNPGS